ncbi:MAG: hypothetical protein HGB28_01425 [Oscillochloris sp.]|nr:hypothetical protein [Oscillochloris sp.]
MKNYKITAIATTKVPPERIFAVLDDFGRWPTWMPAFERIKVDLPANHRPSLNYRFRLRGSVVYADMQVIDFTPLSRATSFRINVPPLTGVNRCLMRPLGHSRYRIERVDTLDLPGVVAGVLDSTQRARFSRLAQEFLSALLRTAETEG